MNKYTPHFIMEKKTRKKTTNSQKQQQALLPKTKALINFWSKNNHSLLQNG